MSRFATAPCALLVLAATLLLCAESAFAFSDMIAINGPSYMWQQVIAIPASKTSITTAFQSDFTAAIGSAGVIVVNDLTVNATAMFVSYTVTGSATQPQAKALLMASTLPQVNTVMNTVKQEAALASIADVFPAEFHPIVPLLPWPDDMPTPAPTITGEGDSIQTILLSGTPSVWSTAVKSQPAEIGDAVCASAFTILSRPLFKVRCVVQSVRVQQAGSLEEMGDGKGGLIARIAIAVEAEELSRHMYDPEEVSSLLLDMDTTGLSVIFNAVNTGNPAQEVKVVTVINSSQTGGVTCTSGCKGMIAMGVIIVVLMVIAFVCGCLFCMCAGARKRTEKFVPTMEQNLSTPSESTPNVLAGRV